MFNKLWVRSVLLFFTFILFIVAGTAAGILGFLYYQKDGDFQDLQDDNDALVEQIEALEAEGSVECPEADECVDENIVFKDTARDVEVTFPSSWKQSLKTTISEDFVYPEDPATPHGKVISGYELTLSKGGAKLTFTKILQAIDGFPTGLTNEEYEIVEVNDEVVRYRANGNDIWVYGQVVECSEMDVEVFPELAGADYCSSHFFPGFGDNANGLTLEGAATDATFAEADAIAISALN